MHGSVEQNGGLAAEGPTSLVKKIKKPGGEVAAIRLSMSCRWQEELAEAALEASGQAVTRHLREALEGASCAGAGLSRFLDLAAGTVADGEYFPGCPVAPAALESPIISPRLRVVAARCFDQWESLIAARLRADGWPEHSVPETASSVLALIEGALLLARVTRQPSHLANAKRAALALLSASNREDR